MLLADAFDGVGYERSSETPSRSLDFSTGVFDGYGRLFLFGCIEANEFSQGQSEGAVRALNGEDARVAQVWVGAVPGCWGRVGRESEGDGGVERERDGRGSDVRLADLQM